MSLKEELITCLNIKDKIKRQVTIASIITEALKPLGIVPIVVGGSAVEFYTFGQYATMDIDFVGMITEEMKQSIGKI